MPHICDEKECPYFGRPSPSLGCKCHKTRDHMMRDALRECEEYFDNRSDVVDGSYGVPEPNREMVLLSEIRAALNN